MITPMVKVTLIGPRRLLMGTLDLLHSDGTVHLDPFPIPVEHRVAGTIRPTPERSDSRAVKEELTALLARATRLRAPLHRPPKAAPLPLWLAADSVSADDLTAALDRAEAEIAPVAEAHRRLKAEEDTFSRYQKVLAALYPLLQEVTEVRKMDLLGVILERKRADVLPLLEKELSRITSGQFQLFTRAMDKDQVAAIIAYPPPLDHVVRELFSQENIAEIRLPEPYADLPLAATLRQLIRRLKELPRLLAEKAGELDELAAGWYPALSRMEEILLDRLDEVTTVTVSAQGSHTFFMRGWIPKDRIPLLTRRVEGAFGGDVLVETAPVAFQEHGQVPVELRNGPFARWFEPFIRLLALPRYGTIDPTPFMAWFFPIFFGFILGDIGYGLILLALAAWLRRRWAGSPFKRNLAGVFLISGGSGAFFGLLFGELFGNLGEHMGLHPLLIDRAVAFMPILYAAVGLGYLHIALGFVLAFVAGLRQGSWRHQAAAGAKLLVMGGALLALLASLNLLPPGLAVPGLAAIGAGALAILLTEGFIGVLELVQMFGNILSYARLMAIGMSSVILAKVANLIGGTAGNIMLGISVALLFHALNFALGVFSPAIHSLRLHYVEFFGKFFQPGGRAYHPFRRHQVV